MGRDLQTGDDAKAPNKQSPAYLNQRGTAMQSAKAFFARNRVRLTCRARARVVRITAERFLFWEDHLTINSQ